MRVTVTQENLHKALSVVSRVAGSKASLPVLGNILLKTENNRLVLAATNLEIAITQNIGAKVISEGSITIPARLLSDFIANLPKTNIDLRVEGVKLHIEANSYSSVINGLASDEFPSLPAIESLKKLTVDTSDFKRAISQTILCASNDDTRPVLTGVLCHCFEGALYMAATDGYRLAERKVVKTELEIHALVPASTLSEVARVIPEDCDSIEMTFDDDQVLYRIGDIELTSRLIEGKFPDYRQLIPNETEIHANLDRSDFVRITKIASLFAKESGGSVTISADSVKKILSIHSVASQLGENTSEANAEVDQDGTVSLNSRYLIDALGCFSDASIQFGFSGKLAPCVITDNKSNSEYKHIVMPLRS